MVFRVCLRREGITLQTNEVCLIQEDWDDYGYKTLFKVLYRDKNYILHDLDYVHIGYFGMEPGFTHVKMNSKFDHLKNHFFSLGSSEKYYEKLNKLDEQVKFDILVCLNDMAFNNKILDHFMEESVVKFSLLRGVTSTTVRNQLHRISRGGAVLTPYKFAYSSITSLNKTEIPQFTIDFSVVPDSNPPTNIHVLIGKNGTGKTLLLQNMIKAIYSDNNCHGLIKHYENDSDGSINEFANVLCVAFSPYDDFSSVAAINQENFQFIGLDKHSSDLDNSICQKFLDYLLSCMGSIPKMERWKEAMNILEFDNMFELTEIHSFSSIWRDDDSNAKTAAKNSIIEHFIKLSSGHKIILLIITACVAKLEEKTILFIDEPENHMHPPLLSAFIRALSYLLTDRNGLAIISTHSPVILQEVPRRCVWKLRRAGAIIIPERIETETFGSSISLLSAEVFGLEITNSGFHKLISQTIDQELQALSSQSNKVNYDDIAALFKYQLGNEAQALIRILLRSYEGYKC